MWEKSDQRIRVNNIDCGRFGNMIKFGFIALLLLLEVLLLLLLVVFL